MELRTMNTAAFETWWEKHGQFCRSGGGDYEKTFAFAAWEAAAELVSASLVAPQEPVAWMCEWPDWRQYHDETDPLPKTWDEAPTKITPLYALPLSPGDSKSELQKSETAHATSPVPSEINKRVLFSAERPAFEKDMIDYGWRDFNGYWTNDCWYYDDRGLQHRWFGWHRRAACEAVVGEVPSNEKTSAVGSPVSAVAEARLVPTPWENAEAYEAWLLRYWPDNAQARAIYHSEMNTRSAFIAGAEWERARSLVGALQGVKA